MGWQQIRIRTNAEHADALEAECVELGAVAVTFEDAGDTPVLEPAPGDMPLWHDLTLTALFDEAADIAGVRNSLAQHGIADEAIAQDDVPDRDWEHEWLRDFEARDIGARLRIVGSHQKEPVDGRIRIVLDPGVAFGTGAHPTTTLVLEWLQEAPLNDCRVLDVGCGSGILAIAALKLGAASADGTDIDPQALTASRQNAGINGVGDRLAVFAPESLPAGRYDVVVANILANTLDTLAPQLAERTRPGGRLAMTGILPDQSAALADRYAPWFEFDAPRASDGWVLMSGVRR